MEPLEERYERGKQLRKDSPRSDHARFERPSGVDPVAVLLDQERDRLAHLIPERHRRMGESPYAFFRAGAALMAADLAAAPSTGIIVQASGDAHLANFGWYGSPERRLVFDVNDFDETLPASFEWDVKRLATSFVVVGQDLGFAANTCTDVARHCVEEYRDAMSQFASQGILDVWYASRSAEAELADLKRAGDAKDAKELARLRHHAKRADSRRVLGKLTERVDGEYRIVADPPLVIPLRGYEHHSADEVRDFVQHTLANYASSMPDHLAALVGRFTYVDAALKVVGVGSVGTRCAIVLLQGRDEGDPLFLQIKEAGPSVLEKAFGASRYTHPGQRVVEGQRLMQTVSDLFLGWTTTPAGRHYYVRQLKDMKASADLEAYGPEEMMRYARACAWTLAQCHARSGDPVMLSGYMGSGEVFADAIAAFATAYAAQNERDYRAFADQVGFSEGTPQGAVQTSD